MKANKGLEYSKNMQLKKVTENVSKTGLKHNKFQANLRMLEFKK